MRFWGKTAKIWVRRSPFDFSFSSRCSSRFPPGCSGAEGSSRLWGLPEVDEVFETCLLQGVDGGFRFRPREAGGVAGRDGTRVVVSPSSPSSSHPSGGWHRPLPGRVSPAQRARVFAPADVVPVRGTALRKPRRHRLRLPRRGGRPPPGNGAVTSPDVRQERPRGWRRRGRGGRAAASGSLHLQ